jgi:cytochrome c-type biogenesis protein CcmH/NrfF
LTLALVLGAGPHAQAQGGEEVKPLERSELQLRLESEIMCTCGGCRLSVANCGMMNCHGQQSQRAKITEHLASGKDHDQVIAAFISEFGQEILMSPVDRGFNRLAWLFPYLLGATGAVAMAVVAVRWSRRPHPAQTEAQLRADPALDERLDDELRNLD